MLRLGPGLSPTHGSAQLALDESDELRVAHRAPVRAAACETLQLLLFVQRERLRTRLVGRDPGAGRLVGLWPTSKTARVKVPEGVSHLQALSGAHLVVPANPHPRVGRVRRQAAAEGARLDAGMRVDPKPTIQSVFMLDHPSSAARATFSQREKGSGGPAGPKFWDRVYCGALEGQGALPSPSGRRWPREAQKNQASTE